MKVLQTHIGPHAHPRWLISLVCLFVSLSVFGQSRRLTGASLYIRPLDTEKSALLNNTYYIVPGGGVEISFFIGIDKLAVPESASGTLTCGSFSRTLEFSYGSDGHFSIESVRFENLSSGEYPVEANISYRSISDDGQEVELTGNMTGSFIVVQNPVAFSSLGAFDGNTMQVFTGHEAEFGYHFDSELPGTEWTTVLEVNGILEGSNAGTDHSIHYWFSNTGSTVSVQEITLVTTCSVGGKQLEEIRNTKSIEVYPVPVLTINAPAREIFNGESLTYTAEVSGGFSTSYSWAVDGQSAGTNSDTYTYTGTCPADASQTHTVAVTVTCSLAGQSVSVEAETTVTVYPRPAVTVSGDAASFSGQSVRFDAAVSGGMPQGRTYQWTLDGNTVGTASSVTVSPANTTNGMIAYTYRLTVTDNLGGGHTATATADVTLNVWPTPHTELVNVNNTPSVVYTGTGVSLSVRASGGAPRQLELPVDK